MTLPAILLTRPADGADRFAAALRDRLGDRITIVSAPVLDIVGTGAVPALSDDPVPVFTSRHGVAHGPKGKGLCYAVGDATARAASRAGYGAVSAAGDVEALFQRILTDAPARPLLHLRGDPSTGDLAARLRAAGLTARDCIVYRQAPRPLTAQARALLDRESAVILPLFSPRSAAQFATEPRGLAPLRVAAISDRVAEAAQPMGPERLIVAARPDMPAMVDAVLGLFDASELLEARPGAH